MLNISYTKNRNNDILKELESEEFTNIKIIINALNEVLQKLKYRYELIFVDDGSSDKTLTILQEISKRHPL